MLRRQYILIVGALALAVAALWVKDGSVVASVYVGGLLNGVLIGSIAFGARRSAAPGSPRGRCGRGRPAMRTGEP